jgi:hypothetical protein
MPGLGIEHFRRSYAVVRQPPPSVWVAVDALCHFRPDICLMRGQSPAADGQSVYEPFFLQPSWEVPAWLAVLTEPAMLHVFLPIWDRGDTADNFYGADTGNHTIRKVTSAGVVSTFAESAGMAGSANGTGGAARFSSPIGVALEAAGDIFVADSDNNTIRKITPEGLVHDRGWPRRCDWQRRWCGRFRALQWSAGCRSGQFT